MERKIKQVFSSNHTNNLSRTLLLTWVNSRLLSKFSSVEELCTGAAYCQLTDILFPNSVAMQRVKFMTNVEKDFLQNFKILQASFNKIGVKQAIPVEKIIKGRFLDNLHFLQWYKQFYDANWWGSPDETYNPVAVRKGAPMGFGPVVVVKNAARLGTNGSQVSINQRAKLPAKPNTRSDKTLSSIPKNDVPIIKVNPKLVAVNQQKLIERKTLDSLNKKRNNELEIMPNQPDRGCCSPDCQKKMQQLNEEIQKLSDELKNMDELVRMCTLSTDSYHSMCRNIERLCKLHDKQGGTVSCNEIYKIIQHTEKGLETPEKLYYSLVY